MNIEDLIKRANLIKSILADLVPLGKYFEEDKEKYIKTIIERVCKRDGLRGDDKKKCETEFSFWINFYYKFFPDRKFIYTQSFLNTTIVNTFLE